MQFPNHERKYENEPLFAAADYVRARLEEGGYPERIASSSAILVYQGNVLEYITSTYDGEWCDVVNFDIYDLDDYDVVVAKPESGAPKTAFLLEILVEYGFDSVLTLEYCGCLQRSIDPDQAIVPDRAIRDEGTSYHYVEPSKYSFGSERMIDALEDTLTANDVPYRVGTSWTTDAFFRETVEEVERYVEEGVCSVDMETSATYALARYHDIDAAALLLPADYLAPDGWDLPDWDLPEYGELNEPMARLADVAVDFLDDW